MNEALATARIALAGRDAWLVGGSVRDRLLGRTTDDLDVAVRDDPESAARAVAAAAPKGSAFFLLSGDFGTWRVVGPQNAWHVDIVSLRGETIEEDLRARDLTVNAMAQPLGGEEVVDPSGGRADLEARIVRAVAEQNFADDPLRCLRVARFACVLDLTIDPETAAMARRHGVGLADVAPERIFGELKHVVAAPAVRAGLEAIDELGLMQHVLPELMPLRGVQQNRYHHADVHDHTLEVLDQVLAISAQPPFAEHADAVAARLAESLADELTRGDALRLGALLHDAAKPQTRRVTAEGQVLGFPGHDVEGEALARGALRRLRTSERLQSHVGALARHHLRLGFLVHEQPLARRALYRYLAATGPVAVDVTLLSIADRLATRGHNAEESIERHLALAREVLSEALRWEAGETRPQPLLRGDELASELGIEPGPQLGPLLAELTEAQFAGEVADRAEAVAYARALPASRRA